jgi:hypothetical protein
VSREHSGSVADPNMPSFFHALDFAPARRCERASYFVAINEKQMQRNPWSASPT